jgi:para-aminobenzoate synthetase/4-amino-4-deoxychorismate lyase
MSSLFPCASITGAPKVSTMRIITSLETSPRQVYTGAIGYLAPGRIASFNVAIRTVLIEQSTGKAEYGIGGGIVWDSTSVDEYDEALLKARVLTVQRPEFSLLETLRWTPGEGYFLLDEHLRRLSESAEYFGFPCEQEKVRAHLAETSLGLPQQPQRVRMLLDMEGNHSTQAFPLELAPTGEPLRLKTASSPINSTDVYLFHKTTWRGVYETARASQTGCDDVILFNERGEVTETSLANLVFRLDGELVTPPVESGLLAGTFRAHLLEQGLIRERIVTITDLPHCTQIFRINSVRGWQPAALVT